MSKYWYLTAGKMKVFSLGLLILSVLAVNAHAQGILGTAGSFAVLGEAGVTNTGPSMIFGSVAGSTGTPAVTGFPPGTVVAPGVLYTTGVANSGPGTPFGDASAAAVIMAGLSSQNLGGVVQLGGATLGAGVYSMGAALLNGTLSLNFTAPGQTIVIDIASTLTTASGPAGPGALGDASVVLTGLADSTDSVYWVVGSSTQIGTYTSFYGNIISLAGVAMQTGATDLCGSVISTAASVTLDTNTINTGCNGATTTTVTGLGPGTGTGFTNLPEGGSPLLYLGFFLLPLGAMRAFRFRRSI
jgi:hypothetical protein